MAAVRPKTEILFISPQLTCLQEAKETNEYALYVSSDSTPEGLDKASDLIRQGNRSAILFYPASHQLKAPSPGTHQYVARIIQAGNAFEIKEVFMGERNFNDSNTRTNPQNLINAVLAKTDIRVAPLLSAIRPDTVFKACLAPKMQKRDLSVLARTSFYANKLAQPVLEQVFLRSLFQLIVDGKRAEAEAIVKTSPQVVLKRYVPHDEADAYITNKLGQRICIKGKTPFMVLLGEGDVDMAPFFKKAILEVADEKEAEAQYKAQLSDGWEEKIDTKPLYDEMEKMFQIVADAKEGDICSSGNPDYQLEVDPRSGTAKAHRPFCDFIEAKRSEAPAVGLRSSWIFFLKTLQLYEQYYGRLGGDWNYPRCLFAWQRIVGQVQRLMPVNDIQGMIDGPAVTAVKLARGEPLNRSLMLKIWHVGQPGDVKDMSGWKKVDLCSSGGELCRVDFVALDEKGRLGRPSWDGASGEWFAAYVNQKQQAYRNLFSHGPAIGTTYTLNR